MRLKDKIDTKASRFLVTKYFFVVINIDRVYLFTSSWIGKQLCIRLPYNNAFYVVLCYQTKYKVEDMVNCQKKWTALAPKRVHNESHTSMTEEEQKPELILLDNSCEISFTHNHKHMYLIDCVHVHLNPCFDKSSGYAFCIHTLS